MITMKFDWDTVTKPVPTHILFCWIAGISGLVGWTIWNFYLHRVFLHLEQKLQNIRARRKHRQRDQGQSVTHDGVSSGSEVDDSLKSDVDHDGMSKKME